MNRDEPPRDDEYFAFNPLEGAEFCLCCGKAHDGAAFSLCKECEKEEDLSRMNEQLIGDEDHGRA